MTRELTIGNIRIIAIEDGYWTPAPDYFFPRWDPDQLDPGQVTLTEDGKIRFGFGCFLVETPAGFAMVDSGGGPDELSPENMNTGALPGELAAIGVDSADVIAVVHTHLHYDHWGGDAHADGSPTFPNAAIFVHPAEYEHFIDDEKVAARLAPLVEADRVEFVTGGTEVYPHMRVIDTSGHTPGHFSIEIDCGGSYALILGDVSHHPFQLDHPDWGIRLDWDHDMAIETRKAVFDGVVERGDVMIGGHYPDPRWGKVVTEGGRRTWRPISPN